MRVDYVFLRALLPLALVAAPLSRARAQGVAGAYPPSACPAIALPAKADSIDRLVVGVMRAQRIPGLALAVVHGDRVEPRAYGYAALEACTPGDTETIFGIGSIGKPMTAYATLRLVQAGKLRLEDTITKWLPEAKPAWDAITVRHLLTHTSGIRDYAGDDPQYPLLTVDRKAELSADSLIRLFARAPLNFAPGADRAYSNTGYVVLSILLERLTGQSFSALMHTLVFDPLGMRSPRLWDPTAVVSGFAQGYDVDSAELRRGGYVGRRFGSYGDTGLLMTAGDLGRFAAELLRPRLLPPDLRRTLVTPVPLRDGWIPAYALGIALDDARGRLLIGHSGSFRPGYTAGLVAFPSLDLAAVVVTNSHSAPAIPLTQAIVAILNDSAAPLPPAPGRDPDTARTRRLLAFLRGDSRAMAVDPGWAAHELLPLRARIARLATLMRSLDFIGCDDLRQATARVIPSAASECYFRLDLGGRGFNLGAYYTARGALVGLEPKGL